jgi:hypothetical protein
MGGRVVDVVQGAGHPAAHGRGSAVQRERARGRERIATGARLRQRVRVLQQGARRACRILPRRLLPLHPAVSPQCY